MVYEVQKSNNSYKTWGIMGEHLYLNGGDNWLSLALTCTPHVMSRKLLTTAVAMTLVGVMTIVNGGVAHAQTPVSAVKSTVSDSSSISIISYITEQRTDTIDLGGIIQTDVPSTPQSKPKKKTEPETPAPVVVTEYTIVPGDTLSAIAERYQTTWLRLWQKNTSLTHQDVLPVGAVVVIPDPQEALAAREPIQLQLVPQTTITRAYGGSVSSGNAYDAGYCTWYVKNRRPDLPNYLGNANRWYSNAKSLGLSVGTIPRAGAVGTTTAGSLGHVVYVESVNTSNGTVTISEMNRHRLFETTSRVASATEFLYIY